MADYNFENGSKSARIVSFISKKDKKIMDNYTEKLQAKRVGNSQIMIIDEKASDSLINSYGLE